MKTTYLVEIVNKRAKELRSTRRTTRKQHTTTIDATVNYTSDPETLRALVDQSGLSRRETARRLGIGYSTLRGYLDGSEPIRYPVLVCLRLLALNKD